jgi:hypothetical protein
MRERGIELVNSARFLEPLLAGEGQLSDRAPNEAERKDLAFGYGWPTRLPVSTSDRPSP